MSFCENLKHYRKLNNFTQSELAQKIGVSKSTIAGYEKGNREPDFSKIRKLTEVLNISGNTLLDIKSSVSDLPDDCLKIAQKYRGLDSHGKRMVQLVIDEEKARMKEPIDKAAENYNMRKITYYELSTASAGSGNILDDEYPSYKEFPNDKVPRDAEFSIRVNGDSMEPEYFDGDIVFLKKSEVRKGEVGVFFVDNEAFIKKVGDNELISLNSDYENIEIHEYNNVKTVGKVIGKL